MFPQSKDVANRFVDSMENPSNTAQGFQGGLEESLVTAQDPGVGKPLEQPSAEIPTTSTSASSGGGGIEFDHQHDAPPPHPEVKPYADFASDTLFLYGGAKTAVDGLKKAIEKGAAAVGYEGAGLAAANAAAKAINYGVQNGWYKMNPHKDL